VIVIQESAQQESDLWYSWHNFIVCVRDRRKLYNVYAFGDPVLEISSLLKGQVEPKSKWQIPISSKIAQHVYVKYLKT
jgi:hypothetical protein